MFSCLPDRARARTPQYVHSTWPYILVTFPLRDLYSGTYKAVMHTLLCDSLQAQETKVCLVAEASFPRVGTSKTILTQGLGDGP